MDFDLYDDLLIGEAEPTEKEQQLLLENENLKKSNAELEDKLRTLIKVNRRLSETTQILEKNISSLIKTARTEINRKNETIATLKREIDNVILRRTLKLGTRDEYRAVLNEINSAVDLNNESLRPVPVPGGAGADDGFVVKSVDKKIHTVVCGNSSFSLIEQGSDLKPDNILKLTDSSSSTKRRLSATSDSPAAKRIHLSKDAKAVENKARQSDKENRSVQVRNSSSAENNRTRKTSQKKDATPCSNAEPSPKGEELKASTDRPQKSIGEDQSKYLRSEMKTDKNADKKEEPSKIKRSEPRNLSPTYISSGSHQANEPLMSSERRKTRPPDIAVKKIQDSRKSTPSSSSKIGQAGVGDKEYKSKDSRTVSSERFSDRNRHERYRTREKHKGEKKIGRKESPRDERRSCHREIATRSRNQSRTEMRRSTPKQDRDRRESRGKNLRDDHLHRSKSKKRASPERRKGVSIENLIKKADVKRDKESLVKSDEDSTSPKTVVDKTSNTDNVTEFAEGRGRSVPAEHSENLEDGEILSENEESQEKKQQKSVLDGDDVPRTDLRQMTEENSVIKVTANKKESTPTSDELGAKQLETEPCLSLQVESARDKSMNCPGNGNNSALRRCNHYDINSDKNQEVECTNAVADSQSSHISKVRQNSEIPETHIQEEKESTSEQVLMNLDPKIDSDSISSNQDDSSEQRHESGTKGQTCELPVDLAKLNTDDLETMIESKMNLMEVLKEKQNRYIQKIKKASCKESSATTGSLKIRINLSRRGSMVSSSPSEEADRPVLLPSKECISTPKEVLSESEFSPEVDIAVSDSMWGVSAGQNLFSDSWITAGSPISMPGQSPKVDFTSTAGIASILKGELVCGGYISPSSGIIRTPTMSQTKTAKDSETLNQKVTPRQSPKNFDLSPSSTSKTTSPPSEEGSHKRISSPPTVKPRNRRELFKSLGLEDTNSCSNFSPPKKSDKSVIKTTFDHADFSSSSKKDPKSPLRRSPRKHSSGGQSSKQKTVSESLNCPKEKTFKRILTFSPDKKKTSRKSLSPQPCRDLSNKILDSHGLSDTHTLVPTSASKSKLTTKTRQSPRKNKLENLLLSCGLEDSPVKSLKSSVNTKQHEPQMKTKNVELSKKDDSRIGSSIESSTEKRSGIESTPKPDVPVSEDLKKDLSTKSTKSKVHVKKRKVQLGFATQPSPSLVVKHSEKNQASSSQPVSSNSNSRPSVFPSASQANVASISVPNSNSRGKTLTHSLGLDLSSDSEFDDLENSPMKKPKKSSFNL